MTQAPQSTDARDDGSTSSSSSSTTPSKAPLHTSLDCSPPKPQAPSPAEREAQRKAAARAYALSAKTNEGRHYKRKLPLQSPQQSPQPEPPPQSPQEQEQPPNPPKPPSSASSHSRTKPPKKPGAASASTNGARSATTAVLPPPPKRQKMAVGTSASASSSSTATNTNTTTKPTSTTSKTIPKPKAASVLPKASSHRGRSPPLPMTKVKAQPTRQRPQPSPKKTPRTAPTSSSSTGAAPVVVAGGPLSGGASASASTNTNTSSGLAKVDYDPEYLKLIQSLGELDDFSIWDNLDMENDEEFRLSDLEDDDDELFDDDDDELDNGDLDESLNNEVPQARGDSGASIKAEAQALAPDTPGPTPRSSNPKSPATTTKQAPAVTPSHQQPPTSTQQQQLASPSLNLPGWDDDREDGGIFYKNLEEELGSLLEEDLEAAVQSLYTTKGGASGSAGKDDSKKKKTKTKALTKKQQQQQHQSQLQQQQQQSQSQQTLSQQPQQLNAFVATTTATAGTGSLTPVTAATLAAEAKRRKEQASKTGIAAKGTSNANPPGTPLRETARQGSSATVTYQQSQQLRTLMKKHYQLLAQQAILSVRAAQSIKSGEGRSSSGSGSSGHSKNSKSSSPTSSSNGSSGGGGDFLCGENETDLTEILDLAVGMLQDLDQNRKDAIRTSIQLAMSGFGNSGGGGGSNAARMNETRATADSNSNSSSTTKQASQPAHPGARRSLLSQFAEGHDDIGPASSSKGSQVLAAQSNAPSNQGGGRLTRAAFRKLQAQPIVGSKRTAFDIPGLLKLDETFATIDDSVNVGPRPRTKANHNGSKGHNPNGKKVNTIEAETHAQACRDVLKDAGANVEEDLLPGVLDVSENFSQLEEHLGEDFKPPCSAEQEQFLRKNRNLFTSGEDNLVLRGVNLYGEKQWILIGDRYLPDRSINIISQRYSKLCVMLYKAHGIRVDAQGNLPEPPKLESVDDIDESKVKAMELKLVEPPAILNVHRWSMEEDLTILKAVPIMGHMWAELGARLIPHRDRGHLRKRYQVLERRVKATVTREFKKAVKGRDRNVSPKSGKGGSTKGNRKAATPRTMTKSMVGKTPKDKASPSSSSTPKVRSSPGRKKPPSPKSPSRTARAKLKKGSPSKVKPKASLTVSASAKPSKTNNSSKSPMMSLESGAALLAGMKPKETEKEANLKSLSTAASTPEAPTPAAKANGKPTTKRGTLQQVGTAAGGGAAAASIRKVPTYPQPKTRAPVEVDANGTKYPHPQTMPHGHTYYHPHYQYHHYYPGYPYPPPPHHAPPSSNEHNNPPHPAKDYYGQPIIIASPKPTKGRFLPKDLDTPNSKSFMRGLLSQYGDADTSREVCENLFDFVGNDDGSQSSKMPNEDESQAANAMSNLLPDTNSNITGMSVLNDTPKKTSKDESGLSIFARVQGSSKEAGPILPTSMPSPTKKSSFFKGIRSPKLKGPAPETPKRDRGFFSTSGTPVGLSPGLRTLRDSSLLKDERIGATSSISAPFSPAPSALLTVPYSPAPSLLFRGFDDKTGDENRFAFDQDSRVCEDSNQLGDLAVGASLSNTDHQPNGNSLSMAPEEIDAISGLGALSNSPFKTVKSLPRSEGDESEKKNKKLPRTEGDESEKKNKKSKSFFARVVGDSKEKSPQKKLRF